MLYPLILALVACVQDPVEPPSPAPVVEQAPVELAPAQGEAPDQAAPSQPDQAPDQAAPSQPDETPVDQAPVGLRPPPEGFVDLASVVPDLRLDVRYHTADNFTGAPLPGYGVPAAWLLDEPAYALAAVAEDIRADGLGLLVFDAYRPHRGTLAMVAWAERTGQDHLLNGYIARLSNHNRGVAVDLTLYELSTGEPLDMGTDFDVLNEAAHTRNAEGPVLDHRLALKAAMAAHGFSAYSKEWWHFTYKLEPRPQHRDVPYSCFEPDEGAWQPPEGWGEPGYVMPMAWVPAPCAAGQPMK